MISAVNILTRFSCLIHEYPSTRILTAALVLINVKTQKEGSS